MWNLMAPLNEIKSKLLTKDDNRTSLITICMSSKKI